MHGLMAKSGPGTLLWHRNQSDKAGAVWSFWPQWLHTSLGYPRKVTCGWQWQRGDWMNWLSRNPSPTRIMLDLHLEAKERVLLSLVEQQQTLQWEDVQHRGDDTSLVSFVHLPFPSASLQGMFGQYLSRTGSMQTFVCFLWTNLPPGVLFHWEGGAGLASERAMLGITENLSSPEVWLQKCCAGLSWHHCTVAQHQMLNYRQNWIYNLLLGNV